MHVWFRNLAISKDAIFTTTRQSWAGMKAVQQSFGGGMLAALVLGFLLGGGDAHGEEKSGAGPGMCCGLQNQACAKQVQQEKNRKAATLVML